MQIIHSLNTKIVVTVSDKVNINHNRKSKSTHKRMSYIEKKIYMD